MGKRRAMGSCFNPVLCRDKLARTFNSRGYVKFTNLAKISRPKNKRGVDRNEMAPPEVVTEEEDSEEDD